MLPRVSNLCAAIAAATTLAALPAAAQTPIPASAVSGLPLRSIGPGLMSGRIADVAVHPRDRHTWYVVAGSAGVWKTTNAGITFAPVFDAQASYSVGTIAIDPKNPETVWVGTGENVSGRHVGWGDGVYKSRDGGQTWQRMGLPQSQHIGKILIDPREPNTVLVAAEGPLWSSGGERGVYRTTDGGATWAAVLTIDANTGVTDMEFDPSNPDVIYAAAYQRRRHVWGFLAGGAGSGIHKSTDNGRTWRRVTAGLPAGDKGKIGLAVTAADPRIVYATIEANEEQRGFYRSRDRGESWEKRNGYISGGTGPHYYQEIEASPVNADLVYQMDVFLQVTRDGGATFTNLESGHDKHSDNHAMWIDPSDGRHMLVGTDAGLYETFDEGARFRHFPNLPAAQFYKVALNDRIPFYDVLGGAQDMGTLLGPSRTMNQDGIRNQDWYVPAGADGYGVAFEPGDPDMAYMMFQEGFLFRRDRRHEEAVTIQPRGKAGDPPERWNWDSPILVSPHQSARLYFGSQRVWRSDDRGDRWTAISPDLTLGQERYAQRYYGRTWSVDALHDNGAMSKYATTTTISESPVSAGTIAVGTDDGLVQVTSDGGTTWTRTAVMPGLPPLSYINDVEMSMRDARTLFVAADNHKMGDFAPYLYTSADLGRTWRSITGDLPRGTIVWAIQQDHVRPELLFAGTEFGTYWSPNGGINWHKLTGGMPTIAVRDIKLHRRDNDLVAATFGRGFYVLDDFTPLREVASGARADGGALLPVRDAWWYVPYQVAQASGRPEKGSDDFTTENPPFGALLTVYLADVPVTQREARRTAEREQRERGVDTPFPGYDRLRDEPLESGPKVMVVVSDATGRRVRTLEVPARAGLHRINWDLRGPSPDPVRMERPAFQPPWVGEPQGPLVAPGRYSAQLVLVSASGARELGSAQSFEVKSVPNVRGTVDFVAAAAFQGRVAEVSRRLSLVSSEIGEVRSELRRVRATLPATPRASPALYAQLDSITVTIARFERRLYGDPARARLDQSNELSISARVGTAESSFGTRIPATATQREQVELADGELGALVREWRGFADGELARLRAALDAAGAPWTPGRDGRTP